ncbi:hypothetical protein, partial [Bifidobacterium dolichotidis]|uniref:hypothetical protein n=1 Tax=Bifidobacterium dolichotidis TaxID=2306976 RepID=UPI0019CFB6C3
DNNHNQKIMIKVVQYTLLSSQTTTTHPNPNQRRNPSGLSGSKKEIYTTLRMNATDLHRIPTIPVPLRRVEIHYLGIYLRENCS